MIWFQAAFDPDARHGKQWVVLEMRLSNPSYTYEEPVKARVFSQWPTRHEAEGHARKAWERLQ